MSAFKAPSAVKKVTHAHLLVTLMWLFIGFLGLSYNASLLYAEGINKNPGGVYRKQKQG